MCEAGRLGQLPAARMITWQDASRDCRQQRKEAYVDHVQNHGKSPESSISKGVKNKPEILMFPFCSQFCVYFCEHEGKGAIFEISAW
jgi:hypothetical protein